jgi:hypothetical protein
VADLHPPLKAFYADDVDLAEWMVEYGHLLEDCDDERELLFIEAPGWFCPEDEFSLFRCLLHAQGVVRIDDDVLEAYIQEVILHMLSLPELEDIFSEDDAADLTSGEMAAHTLVVFGASDLEGWDITLTELNSDKRVISSFKYTTFEAEKNIHLARFSDYFSLEL